MQVPSHTHGGQSFVFRANGKHFTAKVPDGYRGGDMMTVELPKYTLMPSTLKVTVPPGFEGGDNMQFKTADSSLFAVLVPPHLHAGQSFQVVVPGGSAAAASGKPLSNSIFKSPLYSEVYIASVLGH